MATVGEHGTQSTSEAKSQVGILVSMKKLLFVFCLLSTTIYAQQAPLPRPTVPSKYCLLFTLGSTFYVTGLRLDYGQNQRKGMAVQDGPLSTLASEIERYTSIPAALSYLDSQGWELVQASTLPDDKSGQVGYLLRRRMP